MASSNQYKDELDFSEQIKSEVENGNLSVPGLTKEEKKPSEQKTQPDDKRESIGQEMAVLVSNRILNCLEEKSKEEGQSVDTLISVFKNATADFSCSSVTKMQWGIAHVNQYLKTVGKSKNGFAEKIPHLDFTLDAEESVEDGLDVDLFNGVSEAELDGAFDDIKKFNLAGLSFSSWDDLYIEDRDSSCSHELLRKYI